MLLAGGLLVAMGARATSEGESATTTSMIFAWGLANTQAVTIGLIVLAVLIFTLLTVMQSVWGLCVVVLCGSV
ncbi:hypothetical protein AAMO2058_000021200 [Amorphochlora amoebiformis]